MFKRWIFLLPLLLFPLAAGADELTPQKRDDIRKLMELVGGGRVAAQFAGSITQNLAKAVKAARPDAPERAFSAANSDLAALFEEHMGTPDGLVERVIPIYHKYFTHSEIRELLAFYDTAIGRKAIDVLPKVSGESNLAAQAWIQGLGPEINRRIEAALKKEGIEFPRK